MVWSQNALRTGAGYGAARGIPSIFSSETAGEGGFKQLTFLGASITSFNCSLGWNESTSSLSVDLVQDSTNTSDGLGLNAGDDIHHNGQYDQFKPPLIGEPVFFKYGGGFSSISQAYYERFSNFEKSVINTTGGLLPPYDLQGGSWFVFGGILKSYIMNKGTGGYPVFRVEVEDPREILDNVHVVLNDYDGSTLGTDNLINAFGFLEYDISSDLHNALRSYFPNEDRRTKELDPASPNFGAAQGTDSWIDADRRSFPITGFGLSDVNDAGILWWKVRDAINALMENIFRLPEEIAEKQFGGRIKFRGKHYIVDFSEVPKVPLDYRIGSESITLLGFIQEICDIANHDFFIELVPPPSRDNPTTAASSMGATPSAGGLTVLPYDGTIKIRTVNKGAATIPGAITRFITTSEAFGRPVVNSDAGFELINNVTTKFVVGEQQHQLFLIESSGAMNTGKICGDDGKTFVDSAAAGGMNLGAFSDQSGPHHGPGANSVDPISVMGNDETGGHSTTVLPYFGLDASGYAIVAKGPWKHINEYRIELDSRGVRAKGVGDTYDTNIEELKYASIDFKSWKTFLALKSGLNYYHTNPQYGRAGDIGLPIDTSDLMTTFFNPPSLRSQRKPNTQDAYMKVRSATDKNAKMNAQKVYTFVKNIASEYLGKQFMVKLNEHPINSGDADYLPHKSYPKVTWSAVGAGYIPIINLNQWWHSKVDAVKDPIKDKWVFTHEPTEGGFAASGLYPFVDTTNVVHHANNMGGIFPNSRSHPAVAQNLIPVNPHNLLLDDNRFTSYLRFDNVQDRDITKIPDSDLSLNKLDSRIMLPQVLNNQVDTIDPVSTPTYIYPPFDTSQHDNTGTAGSKDPSHRYSAFIKAELGESIVFPQTVIETTVKFHPRREVVSYYEYWTPGHDEMDYAGNVTVVAQGTYQVLDFDDVPMVPDGIGGRELADFEHITKEIPGAPYGHEYAADDWLHQGPLQPKANFTFVDDQWNFTDFTGLQAGPPPVATNDNNAQQFRVWKSDPNPEHRPRVFEGIMFGHTHVDDNHWRGSDPRVVVKIGSRVLPEAPGRENPNTVDGVFVDFLTGELAGHPARVNPETCGADFFLSKFGSEVFSPWHPRYEASVTLIVSYVKLLLAGNALPAVAAGSAEEAAQTLVNGFSDEQKDEIEAKYPGNQGGILRSPVPQRLRTKAGEKINTNVWHESESYRVKDSDALTYGADGDGPKHQEMVDFGAAGGGGGRTAVFWVTPETILVTRGTSAAKGHGLGEKGLKPVPHHSGRRYVKDEALAQVAQQIFRVGSDKDRTFKSADIVWPDMCAVALKSNIETYGPWLTPPDNRGPHGLLPSGYLSGKTEFETDESLSPWAQGGWKQLDHTGNAKAALALSEDQFVERGGLTLVGAPSGSIGEALIDSGPFVTDISVSVGTAGVTSTYKMQTHTPKYGKMARFQMDKIKRLTLEAQKMKRKTRALRAKFGTPQSRGKNREAYKDMDFFDESLHRGSSWDFISFDSFRSFDNLTPTDPEAPMSDTLIPITVVQPEGDLDQQMPLGTEYQRRGGAGVESVLRGFSTNHLPSGFDGGSADSYLSSYDKPAYDVVNKVYVNKLRNTTFEPTLFDLDPFAVGHDVSNIIRGISLPNEGLNVDIGRGQNYSGWASGQRPHNHPKVLDAPLTDNRPISLRGPLVVTGWGYDTNGNPVPASADAIGAMTGGGADVRSKKGNPGGRVGGHLTKSDTWKSGPVDLRWDNIRKVWAGGLIVKEGFLVTSLDAPTINIEDYGGLDDIDKKSPDAIDISACTSGVLLVCEGLDDEYSPVLLPGEENVDEQSRLKKKTIVVKNRNPNFSAGFGDHLICGYINNEWRPLVGPAAGAGAGAKGAIGDWSFNSMIGHSIHWIGNPEQYEIQFHVNYYNTVSVSSPQDPATVDLATTLTKRGGAADGFNKVNNTQPNRAWGMGHSPVFDASNAAIPGVNYWQITGFDHVRSDRLLGTRSTGSEIPAEVFGSHEFCGVAFPQGYSSPGTSWLKGFDVYPNTAPAGAPILQSIDSQKNYISAGVTATGPETSLNEGTAYKVPADIGINTMPYISNGVFNRSVVGGSSPRYILSVAPPAAEVFGSVRSVLPISDVPGYFSWGDAQAKSLPVFSSWTDHDGNLSNVFAGTPASMNNIQMIITKPMSTNAFPHHGFLQRSFTIAGAFQSSLFGPTMEPDLDEQVQVITAKAQVRSGDAELSDIVVHGQIGGRVSAGGTSAFNPTDSQLHGKVFLRHPDDLTVFDPRSGAIFHYNPSGLEPSHRDGKLLPYCFNTRESGVLSYTVYGGGAGYHSWDRVKVVNAGGSVQASGKPILGSNGDITGIIITEKGRGYIEDSPGTSDDDIDTAHGKIVVDTDGGSGCSLRGIVGPYYRPDCDERPTEVQPWKIIGMRTNPSTSTWPFSNPPSKGPVTSSLNLRAASEGEVGTRDYDVFIMMHGNPMLAHGMQYFDITFNTL